MHVVGGLPRSGSKLLSNILSQNPKHYVTADSTLPLFVNALSQVASMCPEFRTELRHRDRGEELFRGAVRAFQESWHQQEPGTVVFDKSHLWTMNPLLLGSIWPGGKTICCVRDLRPIFASFEKHHRKNAFLDDLPPQARKTITARALWFFSREGMIGSPLTGVQDILRRNLHKSSDAQPATVFFWKYEDFIEDPEGSMNSLYEFLGEEPFAHNFSDVEKGEDDPDWQHMWKVPHDGCGAVKSPEEIKDEWCPYFAPGVAEAIQSRFAWYNGQFGYPSAPARLEHDLFLDPDGAGSLFSQLRLEHLPGS
jgi:sulfotransferase